MLVEEQLKVDSADEKHNYSCCFDTMVAQADYWKVVYLLMTVNMTVPRHAVDIVPMDANAGIDLFVVEVGRVMFDLHLVSVSNSLIPFS